MNNEEIIHQAALSIYSEEQIQAFYDAGTVIPLHTFAVWKELGYVPKKGSHGLKVRLWRHKTKKNGSEEEYSVDGSDPEKSANYYMVNAYLFDVSQVQKLECA